MLLKFTKNWVGPNSYALVPFLKKKGWSTYILFERIFLCNLNDKFLHELWSFFSKTFFKTASTASSIELCKNLWFDAYSESDTNNTAQL